METAATRAPAGEAISSVAVLPFLDFSPGKDQEYFSDGLTEEIIDAVSRVPNLRVVARTSAFAFKGQAVDIRQIGAQLGADWRCSKAAFAASGEDLRITAQLNRVSDGSHYWSRTYDRKLRDVFAVQREISEAIADQVRTGELPAGGPAAGVHDAEAYRLLQEGRYFFNQFQPPESNRKAIDRFEKAIARDPNFAPAYSGLADAYAYLAETFVSAPNEVMPKAREAATKAVALDDNSAAAHTSLGAVMLDYDRDIPGAQRELRRAVQLNPGSSYSHHWYAHSLEAQGRLPEAMKEMRVALDLDPLSLPVTWDIGNELICARQFEEAARHLSKAHDLFPNNPIIEFLRAESFNRLGDREAERKVVDSMRANAPEAVDDPMFISLFGLEAVRQGRRDEALRALDRLEGLRRTQYVGTGDRAGTVLGVARESEAGMEWLRRAGSRAVHYVCVFADDERVLPVGSEGAGGTALIAGADRADAEGDHSRAGVGSCGRRTSATTWRTASTMASGASYRRSPEPSSTAIFPAWIS